MIDIEGAIFTPIARMLREKYKGISVSSDYVNAPSSFPYVSVVEQDNYPTPGTQDTGSKEAFASLMYEVSVYSNKASGKKQECRKIMSTIDDFLYSHNFTRISMVPVPNMADNTIYRLVARYRTVTDGINMYRR